MREACPLRQCRNMVEAPGIEPRDTCAPIVAKRREDDADRATEDDSKRREVSASTPLPLLARNRELLFLANNHTLSCGRMVCTRAVPRSSISSSSVQTEIPSRSASHT